jgi:hypothetical protein
MYIRGHRRITAPHSASSAFYRRRPVRRRQRRGRPAGQGPGVRLHRRRRDEAVWGDPGRRCVQRLWMRQPGGRAHRRQRGRAAQAAAAATGGAACGPTRHLPRAARQGPVVAVRAGLRRRRGVRPLPQRRRWWRWRGAAPHDRRAAVASCATHCAHVKWRERHNAYGCSAGRTTLRRLNMSNSGRPLPSS